MSVITPELLFNLDAQTVKLLSKSPDSAVREMSFNEIARRATEGKAEAIAFSNSTFFEFSDGSLMSLSKVAFIAYSSIPTKAKSGINDKTGKEWSVEETPLALAEQGEAWDILRKVQEGFVAQGKTLALTTAGLRALIG